MVLGLIMEIIIFFMGIYYVFTDGLVGYILMGSMLFSFIVGFVYDKYLFKDALYSWKMLGRLFK